MGPTVYGVRRFNFPMSSAGRGNFLANQLNEFLALNPKISIVDVSTNWREGRSRANTLYLNVLYRGGGGPFRTWAVEFNATQAVTCEEYAQAFFDANPGWSPLKTVTLSRPDVKPRERKLLVIYGTNQNLQLPCSLNAPVGAPAEDVAEGDEALFFDVDDLTRPGLNALNLGNLSWPAGATNLLIRSLGSNPDQCAWGGIAPCCEAADPFAEPTQLDPELLCYSCYDEETPLTITSFTYSTTTSSSSSSTTSTSTTSTTTTSTTSTTTTSTSTTTTVTTTTSTTTTTVTTTTTTTSTTTTTTTTTSTTTAEPPACCEVIWRSDWDCETFDWGVPYQFSDQPVDPCGTDNEWLSFGCYAETTRYYVNCEITPPEAPDVEHDPSCCAPCDDCGPVPQPNATISGATGICAAGLDGSYTFSRYEFVPETNTCFWFFNIGIGDSLFISYSIDDEGWCAGITNEYLSCLMGITHDFACVGGQLTGSAHCTHVPPTCADSSFDLSIG